MNFSNTLLKSNIFYYKNLVFYSKSNNENNFLKDFDTVGLLIRSPTNLYIANIQSGILSVITI